MRHGGPTSLTRFPPALPARLLLPAATTRTVRRCLAAALLFATVGHAEIPAGATPRPVTLDGILHAGSDDTLAFTPDGATVFFDRSEGTHKTIMVAQRVDGHWTPPRVAGFSGRWFDQDPLVAPGGGYLLFNSDRPVRPGGQPLVQDYFAGGRAPGSNLWRVDRKGDGWGEPVWLGPAINDDVFIDFASLARDGTLYFMRFDPKARVMHTWRARYRDGRYLAPERAGLGDPQVSTHDPAVAPDESFIVFDYGKVQGGLGRLCLAFREGDHWSRPIDLGDAINRDLPWGAHLAPDGHTVYVTGQAGIRQFSLEPWLRRHRATAEPGGCRLSAAPSPRTSPSRARAR